MSPLEKWLTIRGSKVKLAVAPQGLGYLIRAELDGESVERTHTFGAEDGHHDEDYTQAKLERDLGTACEQAAKRVEWRVRIRKMIEQLSAARS